MAPPKTVLVTGASRGIGQAISRRLLADGHSVVGLARDFSPFPDRPSTFHAVEIDLAKLDRLPDRLKSVQAEHPEIESVVFNAGRGHFGSLEEFSFAQIRSLIELNFVSHAYVARALLPAIKRHGRGHLVFVGSEAALLGQKKGAVYCASKFAIRGFAQALRDECASSGVRVSIINPGMVRTGFFDSLDFYPGEDEGNSILPDDIAETVSTILASRAGTNFDEINLSPLKKVIRFRSKKKDPSTLR